MYVLYIVFLLEMFGTATIKENYNWLYFSFTGNTLKKTKNVWYRK